MKTGFYVSRGTFWGKKLFPKIHNSVFFSFFSDFEQQILGRVAKTILHVKKNSLKKKILLKNVILWLFSDFWQNLVGTVVKTAF